MSIETMTKLAEYTVGAGGISSYNFSNIPQNYTDLVIIGSVRTNRSGQVEDGLAMIINDLLTGYTYRGLIGNGASASSINTAYEQPWFTRVPGATATSGVFGNFTVTIPRYSEYTQKAYAVDGVQENNTTTGYLNLMAITNSTTLPITSLEFTSATGATMVEYSTITLYGVKNARTSIGNSIKASGGQIGFDGTYVTHTFNSSGTFIPFDDLFVDYLVIAGGGGGGSRNGAGGGGAGGYLEGSNFYIPDSASYAITVGAGGTGGLDSVSPYAGSNGSTSQFFTIASTGGGGGSLTSGLSGGSGGGGGRVAPHTGGSGVSGQGYSGGTSGVGLGGAGGGGASQVGANGGTTAGGKGGDGVSSNISGYSIFRGGGGGGSGEDGTGVGGAGGLGGGGAGANVSSGTGGAGFNGSPNTGGGGGGGAYTGSNIPGGTGGSGVVIIRYKA